MGLHRLCISEDILVTDPTPARIVISPHPLGSGYTVTTYANGRPSVIPAGDIEQARRQAKQLAATAGTGYRIIEETRLTWPLYVE